MEQLESETYVSSAERRMPEEIGIDCKMNYMNKFEYHVPYKDIGSENEICGTLIGIVDDFDETCLIKDEISEIKWIDPDELKNELQQNMDVYCPWMVIALYFLDRSSYPNGDKFHSLIKNWTKNDSIYKNAIKHYIPDNNWRRVSDG